MADTKTRMEIYMGLAVAFDRPQRHLFWSQEDHSLSTILSSKSSSYLLSISRGSTIDFFAFVKKNANNIDDKFWQDLEIEFNRLFVGPYSPKAHPNESIYRVPYNGALDECVLRICEAYSREGLSVRQDSHRLPDHIVAELEYMAILCERELESRHNNRKEKTLEYLLKEYDFLIEHLEMWVSEFSNRIESSTDLQFYLSLAGILRDFISVDVEKLRDEISREEANVQNSPADSRHDRNLTPPACEEIKEEGINYSVEIKESDCILCAACAANCPTRAFRITNDQQSSQLLFKVELCSGCKQCIAVCPQQAIELSSGWVPQNAGMEQEWVLVATAQTIRCSGCGTIYSQDRMQQRVLASFSKEEYGDALLEMLSLCAECKSKRLINSYHQGVHKHHTVV
jgi:TorA maturation chaperone TorD/Pyruvate/2-oxoacid:ferredoxin oxidoreductase delta subunit